MVKVQDAVRRVVVRLAAAAVVGLAAAVVFDSTGAASQMSGAASQMSGTHLPGSSDANAADGPAWQSTVMEPQAPLSSMSAPAGARLLERPPDVLAAGDLTLGRGIGARLAKGDDLLSQLRPALQWARVAVANLEGPLIEIPVLRAGVSPIDLTGRPAAAAALGGSFDLLGLANNHIHDAGPGGLAATRRALVGEGIMPIPSKGEVRAGVGGQNVSFRAVSLVRSSTLEPALLDGIRTARRRGDLPMVLVHWGVDGQPVVSAEQQAVARAFSAAGAVAVLGAGPHTVLPVDVLEPPAGAQPPPEGARSVSEQGQSPSSRAQSPPGGSQSPPPRRGAEPVAPRSRIGTIVAYSLGDVLFDSPVSRFEGALLALWLGPSGIEDWRLLPLRLSPRGPTLEVRRPGD